MTEQVKKATETAHHERMSRHQVLRGYARSFESYLFNRLELAERDEVDGVGMWNPRTLFQSCLDDYSKSMDS